jgi:hypothetical protein
VDLNQQHRSVRVELLILGCRMHLGEPATDDSDSEFLNKQLTLLHRLKWRLHNHEQLCRYQKEFLTACEAGANWYWEEK